MWVWIPVFVCITKTGVGMEENVDERSDSKFSDYIPKAQAEGISNNFIEESFTEES